MKKKSNFMVECNGKLYDIDADRYAMLFFADERRKDDINKQKKRHSE